ncbi:lipoprotein signal peptidase [Pseudooceanicola batsensis HTCC2597]|uniref:Lipoprotein signal peptidase n=1 Tax=Pseudooceanicola batsensis (strain ATCC BAA-863 / DSM 15984 / KCTC 12145 / HTCC2597) TaxID=252305 RepID=A3TW15_PSEBH|nr:signal peptidase II [Pseudooceanicola batsensis]EAQ03811.1 lipoprotein signal peptidase [Pseudooceanicola batsensis HTCC2597]
MRIVYWTAFWAFLIDQATKYLVVHAMNLAERGTIEVYPPLLTLRMAWNTGINFGLFAEGAASSRWILIAVALLISVGVLYWAYRERPRRAGLVATGLLVGGAIGNVIDRLLYGAVADFLNVSCCGIDNPFAFNVADMAIFVGAAVLVLLPGEKGT